MDLRRRVIGYAAQRGILIGLIGSYGVLSKLTPRQQRRAGHKLRQALYAPRPRNADVPF